MSISLNQARSAKKKLATLLFMTELPVVGIGITKIGDDYGVRLNLSNTNADIIIPKKNDDVPIEIIVVTTIQKQEN